LCRAFVFLDCDDYLHRSFIKEMVKTLFALFFGMFVFNAAFAQKKDTVVYYLTNSGKPVVNKADADLILMILPPDPGIDKKLFIVKGYYLNGRIRLLGSSKTPAMPLNLQGAFLDFYPNGQKRKMQTFDNGDAVGNIVEYYPNGKLYTVKALVKYGQPKLMQCNDSTGVVLAENGKGRWKEFNNNFTVAGMEGEVAKGIPQGVWRQKLNDSASIESTFNNGTLTSVNRVYKYKSDSTIYSNADSLAKFKGGLNALYSYIGKHIRYPAAAREQNTQGRVVIGFVVEKDGYLSNFKVVRGIGNGCEQEVIRVLTASPPWAPASINGKTVRLSYSVPVSFTLSIDKSMGDVIAGQGSSTMPDKNGNEVSGKIFTAVEQSPEFPGGLEAFYKFLVKNVHYPDAARNNNTSGRVIVQFVVERDGSLSDIKVVRSLGDGCDEEALRVMKLSPRWKPGIQNGNPVRVIYSIPVNFTPDN